MALAGDWINAVKGSVVVLVDVVVEVDVVVDVVVVVVDVLVVVLVEVVVDSVVVVVSRVVVVDSVVVVVVVVVVEGLDMRLIEKTCSLQFDSLNSMQPLEFAWTSVRLAESSSTS